MEPDFVLNGQGFGSVASRLLATNGDVTVMRPYIGADNRHYVTQLVTNGAGAVVESACLIHNGNALLRKNDWIAMDQEVERVAKPRLQMVGDLRSSGMDIILPNGMAKSTFEYEAMTDISRASTSMDGIRRGQSDRVTFDIRGLPLPIIHKDFHLSMREVLISRNGGSPLDLTGAGLASERVAEEVERYAIGLNDIYQFAGYNVYGARTFPQRLTKTLTLPTAAGWTPEVLVNEVIAMREQLKAAYHYGPFRLYFSTDWEAYLDKDYSAAKGEKTLRKRIEEIMSITSVKCLDYLTGFQAFMIENNKNAMSIVVGMEMTTIQWSSPDGLEYNFKVMCIMVPRFKYDTAGNCGILHATAA